jgi:L-2,4-diaminobutyrate decarboxylase
VTGAAAQAAETVAAAESAVVPENGVPNRDADRAGRTAGLGTDAVPVAGPAGQAAETVAVPGSGAVPVAGPAALAVGKTAAAWNSAAVGNAAVPGTAAVSANAAAPTAGTPAGGSAAAALSAVLPTGGEPIGVLPERGVGEVAALRDVTALLAAGSVDPANPWCAAHLHGPVLAVAAAADLVGSVLNPSMDSWDQAPIASELEREVTGALARLCFAGQPGPDALLTSGGTESNLLGLLLAREAGHPQVFCGRNAHHSVSRAAWLLGLPAPRLVDTVGGRMDPRHLAEILTGNAIVVATAGTTDTGVVDPLPEIAAVAACAGARLHVDAAYGGTALFSDRLAGLLEGLDRADSVALDLHKFGWQPISAGVLATREPVTALDVRADYLNAGDDTEAGVPDLVGRSIRTSRRPDCVKIAATFRALGRQGIGALVERCCTLAGEVADAVEAHPGLRLWGRPTLSTLLVRPVAAPETAEGDALVAAVRRRLMADGTAVLGRATLDRVWLKLTLLHPAASIEDYRGLLDLVDTTARRVLP